MSFSIFHDCVFTVLGSNNWKFVFATECFLDVVTAQNTYENTECLRGSTRFQIVGLNPPTR